MKPSLFIFSLFFICNIFGQEIPNDSILLKTIFDHVDFKKETATIERPDDYKDNIWGDSMNFEVVFKEYVLVEGQELLLVACEAFCFQNTGHYFGYRNKYFFRKNKVGFEIVKKMENDEPIPIGDNSGMEIVRIGRTKSALKSQFSSTGNRHYERDITFSLITLDGLKDLINIQMDYSTEAWDIPYKDCNIRPYESTYKIIENDKEWFDIKIEKLTKIYSKDCLVIDEKKESSIYQYIDNEYKLIE